MKLSATVIAAFLLFFYSVESHAQGTSSTANNKADTTSLLASQITTETIVVNGGLKDSQALLLNCTIGLFSSFAGAGAAFALQGWRERRSDRKQELVGLRKALYILKQQCDVANSFMSGAAELKKDKAALVEIVGDYTCLEFDFRSLEFLPGNGQNKIFDDIMSCQELFKVLLSRVQTRNDLSRSIVTFEANAVTDRGSIEFKRKSATVDQMIKLQSLTDHIFELCDKCVKNTVETHVEIEKFIKHKYRKNVNPRPEMRAEASEEDVSLTGR